MLRSMTGYGRGEATVGDITVLVELRSVNNRFRDLQLRCPREYMALEPRITNLLKQPFQRGRIDAFVRRSVATGQQVVETDLELANAYLTAVRRLSASLDGLDEDRAPLSFVLQQPGVLTVTEAEVDVSREWSVVETALQSAIQDLLRMREQEGAALLTDLRGHLADLRTCVGQVEAATQGINERLRSRLETRLERLLGDRLDTARLGQEAALLADKADVSEEIARLASHIQQFNEALDSDEAVGRRLDFLLQEMHREVNTIGSKAAEHPVSQRVVEMKSVLERMREQSANVE